MTTERSQERWEMWGEKMQKGLLTCIKTFENDLQKSCQPEGGSTYSGLW